MRTDQQRLDHELDFVASQQAELEEALAPLEASLTAQGQVETLDYWTTGLLDYCIVNVLYRADGGHREGEDVRPGREPGRAAGQDV